MKKAALVGVAALMLAGVASSYFSPHFTLYQMKSAIDAKDADGFSEHVDFPSLRESFKGQLMASMNQRMSSPEMKDNPLAGLGQAMANAFIGPMIDNMISPAGVIAMMQNGKPSVPNVAKVSAPVDAEKESPEFAIAYRDWGRVVVQRKDKSEDVAKFILKRDGLWGWKLAAVEISAELRSK